MNDNNSNNSNDLTAEERKRKRLEAWRLRQQQQQQQATPPPPPPPKPKVSIVLPKLSVKKKKPKTATTNVAFTSSARNESTGKSNVFDMDDNETEGDNGVDGNNRRKRPLDLLLTTDIAPGASTGSIGLFPPVTAPTSSTLNNDTRESTKTATNTPTSQTRKRRWDNPGQSVVEVSTTAFVNENSTTTASSRGVDALDEFMENLESQTVHNQHPTSKRLTTNKESNLGMVPPKAPVNDTISHPIISSGGVITAEELELLQNNSTISMKPTDDVINSMQNENQEDDETEERARRALIEALKQQQPVIQSEDEQYIAKQQEEDNSGSINETATTMTKTIRLAAEVKSEKVQREERLRELEAEAARARKSSEKNEPELGRYLFDDTESGIMEEAERNLEAAMAAPDALTVLAELNKKKEIQAVDHASIDYMPFTKNLYRVPRALADLKHEEIIDRRAKLKVRVRGHGAPAPIQSFEQAGLSEAILSVLRNQNIVEPYPVQAQCIPCIMAGRDVIGIAKTGSGKTLAYLLPLLRHILVQPPLAANETGPIGLILAPARELAFQIHSVCKMFAKHLGLKSIAVYGGAGVAEQIADLKRGAHIVTATPGRLIDILTMQSGKILSLRRVTYVVMDEADRMFDMGFAPQISALLAAVRPDRQTVLFSATFPKAIETLARSSLKYPLEVVVGGRSVASENVKQYAELVEEEEKFLRLLQILGENIDGTKKAIVFVDTQVRADALFEQLLRSGYSTLSLHGGKDQEDRDSTIADFKEKEGPNILVATGVAGRGLDVARVCCVINYSSPNHLEAYVHQTGRTGRAGNTGVAYTFVNSTDEAKFAPIIVRALSEAGQGENIDPALTQLSEEFKAKVEKGEAKYAGSGFKGKGYSYDSSELSEAQRIARLEKRQALIDAGLLDPDDEDPLVSEGIPGKSNADAGDDGENKRASTARDAISQIKIPENLTPELLALPGMKEALLRTAGIISGDDGRTDETENRYLGRPVQTSDNHWVQEFEINDYPREARWRVTQKETTSRLQEEFRTAVTLKGSYFPPGKEPADGERKLYLHLEATSGTILRNGVMEISRLLNEETLRVSAKLSIPGSHKYIVLG